MGKILGIFACAAILGCAATDETTKPAGATRTDPPVAVCEATHVADGPACAPKFDSCGETEVAVLGGGCRAVGVAACAKGFVAEKGGCSATLPATPCPAGSIALPGMTSCEPIAECGSGTFGSIPDSSSTVHVDGAYAGGGSDGSRGKPFTKIADAMGRVADGGVVAVAAGTYEEDVAVAKRVELRGRCPSMVTIKGVSDGARDGTVLVTAAGAKVSSVSLTGPASGLIVDAVANVSVDSVRVSGATITTGIWLRRGATATTVRRVVVEDVKNYGILVSGSSARLDGVHIHDVREDTSACGLRVNPDPVSFAPSEATVVGSLIEKNDYANVQALSAKLTIEGSVIRDGVQTGGEWGAGVLSTSVDATKPTAEVTLKSSVVEGNSYIGVLARDAKLVVEDSVVRDTKLDGKDKNYGRGIVAQGVSGKRTTLTVKGSVVERNYETGIDLNGDAVARIEDTIVRGTKANTEHTGTGIFGELLNKNAPDLTVDRCLIVDNPNGGLLGAAHTTVTASRFERNGGLSLGSRGAELSIARSLIHDSRPSEDGLDGHGVYGALDDVRFLAAKITVEDSLIEKAFKGGVVVVGGELFVRRSAVRDVFAEKATGESGIGIVVDRVHPDAPASLEVTQSLIQNSEAAGIAAMGGDAKLTGVHVRDVRPHDDGQFGDGLIAFGAVFNTGLIMGSSVTLEGSLIDKSARAGVAVFGSNLSIAGSFVRCNPLTIDVEPIGGFDGRDWVPNPFSLQDGGGNLCGCDADEKCTAQSANLRPLPPATHSKI